MVKKITLISQYIKDLSFENYAAQTYQFEKTKLDFNIDINIKTKKIKNNFVEVTLLILLKANSSNQKKFLIELSYGSVFKLESITQSKDNTKLLFIECPSIMFPFVREIIFTISRDSGFSPIKLNYIDFSELFEKKIKTNYKLPNSLNH